jgi:hypothetical protein
MSKLYTITAVPILCEDEVPYSYDEDGFVRWVDEVFMEGYKKPDDAPFPSVGECLDLLEGQGYTVEVSDA